MNIYIIQNLEGKSKKEAEVERQPIKDYFAARNAPIQDNIEVKPDNNTFEELNIRSKIEGLMSKSDLFVYMSGWKDSKRCQMEDDIVHRYNLPSWRPTWC